MKQFYFILPLWLLISTISFGDSSKFIDIVGTKTDAESLKIIESAINTGSNPNTLDTDGKGPIYWAVYSNYPKSLAKLLASGGNPNIRDKQNLTPLMNAAEAAGKDSKFDRIVGILIKNGADINADRNGITALSYAFSPFDKDQSKSAPVIEYLLKKGANPNIAATPDPKIFGITPLMVAARAGNAAVARVLIKYKARIDQKGPGGKTAIEIAIDNKHPELANELKLALKRQ